MKYNLKLLCGAIGLASTMASQPIQAALPGNAVLELNTGLTILVCELDQSIGNLVNGCPYGITATAFKGSWFSMDKDFSGTVDTTLGEVTVIRNNQGIVLGTSQPASGSHTGAPTGSESPSIDTPWLFFSSTGMHQSTSTITILSDNNGGNVTLDFAGWDVTWNNIASIPMGAGADNGIASMTCYAGAIPIPTQLSEWDDPTTMTWPATTDCVDGSPYLLTYKATVPAGDPSGFGGVPYVLHAEGTVSVPNDAPVASPFSVAAVANATLVVDVASNATDADDNLDINSVAILNDSSCGTITNNGNGTVTLPSCPSSVSPYTFNYTIDDTLPVTSNSALVTVTVAGNPAPNTVTDSASTDGITPVVIDVAANDSDNSALNLASVAQETAPGHGTLSAFNTTTGAITYVANAGFSGVDTFTYTIEDDAAQPSAATTVTVTVNALDNPASSDTLVIGTTAAGAGSTNGIVTAIEIGVTDNGSNAEQGILQTCIGGCFDFVITGVTAQTQVVLPLSTAIPTPAAGNSIIYRKLKSTGWVNFDTSGNNAIDTAAGTVSGSNITCPTPDDNASYSAGLTTGDRCIRLTIVDDGPNDDDATTPGTVADPSGLAESFTVDTRTSGTDGCSMSGNTIESSQRADWWIVACFLGLLGLFRLKHKQQV